jgi:competence transcription factor ComK
MAEFKAKKVEFQNSNRLYLHLSRASFANISGYSVNVHYELGEEKADLIVLMDAELDVVD